MTRQEVIERLKSIKSLVDKYDDVVALREAIKVLEREPMFIAKSDGTIEQIKNCDDCLYKKEWEKIGKLIKVVFEKQTEQEPCEDAISRQATLEPYKRLKDTDTLCVALIRANIMQQPSIKPQEPPKHTKCDRCPYGETKVVNICNYDGDGCGWD